VREAADLQLPDDLSDRVRGDGRQGRLQRSQHRGWQVEQLRAARDLRRNLGLRHLALSPDLGLIAELRFSALKDGSQYWLRLLCVRLHLDCEPLQQCLWIDAGVRRRRRGCGRARAEGEATNLPLNDGRRGLERGTRARVGRIGWSGWRVGGGRRGRRCCCRSDG
jgi:hypothetical protein